MVRPSVRVAFYLMILLFSLADAAEICRRSFYIREDIDLFGNYTDLVTLTMGCSQPGFPSLTVTVEPKLRSQIEQRESRNPKVAFSIRCERNGAINYMNSSVTVRKSEPWISFLQFSSDLPLGQSCSVVGCFWDSYRFPETVVEQRRFAVKGFSCITNLNECEIDPGQCEQVCVDTIAAYKCSCWSGYRLENNCRNCSDVDECLSGAHVCSHNCHNTEGSYSCSCPSGYNLLEDNITCTNINECLSEENPCDHQCNDTDGSFMCLCREGFKLSDDQHSCEDINECDPESSTNQCQHSCTNTIGSYSCSCDTGFTLIADHHNCVAKASECNCESSGSSSSSAVAAVGGVLAGVTVTAIVLLVIVIVVLMRRLNRAETCTTSQPLKRFLATPLEAYSVVRGTGETQDTTYKTVMS